MDLNIKVNREQIREKDLIKELSSLQIQHSKDQKLEKQHEEILKSQKEAEMKARREERLNKRSQEYEFLIMIL